MQFNPQELKEKLLKALDKDQNVRNFLTFFDYVLKNYTFSVGITNVQWKTAQNNDRFGPVSRLPIVVYVQKFIHKMFIIHRPSRPNFRSGEVEYSEIEDRAKNARSWSRMVAISVEATVIHVSAARCLCSREAGSCLLLLRHRLLSSKNRSRLAVGAGRLELDQYCCSS